MPLLGSSAPPAPSPPAAAGDGSLPAAVRDSVSRAIAGICSRLSPSAAKARTKANRVGCARGSATVWPAVGRGGPDRDWRAPASAMACDRNREKGGVRQLGDRAPRPSRLPEAVEQHRAAGGRPAWRRDLHKRVGRVEPLPASQPRATWTSLAVRTGERGNRLADAQIGEAAIAGGRAERTLRHAEAAELTAIVTCDVGKAIFVVANEADAAAGQRRPAQSASSVSAETATAAPGESLGTQLGLTLRRSSARRPRSRAWPGARPGDRRPGPAYATRWLPAQPPRQARSPPPAQSPSDPGQSHRLHQRSRPHGYPANAPPVRALGLTPQAVRNSTRNAYTLERSAGGWRRHLPLYAAQQPRPLEVSDERRPACCGGRGTHVR